MRADEETSVPSWMNRYPAADITAAEFERFVAETLEAIEPRPQGYEVRLHDAIEGTDGTFTFDATARFEIGGLGFLTVIEAKRHANPIKREQVQVLHAKARSVGAHKAVMISTAKYQSGALRFAQVHGIALLSVTEGRFLIETRAVEPRPALSREQASQRFGISTFVAIRFDSMAKLDSVRVALISTKDPQHLHEVLVEVPGFK